MMEVARVFGSLLSKGWRPRRTIVLASWAAEESGIQGSYEWVNHHVSKLMQRTVGLVNTDICVTDGPILKAKASPVLKDLVRNALEKADDPTTDGDRKYYEFWEEWTNQVKITILKDWYFFRKIVLTYYWEKNCSINREKLLQIQGCRSLIFK